MSKARDIADSTTTLDVDGGTIKLDGNYPVGSNNVALGNDAMLRIESGADSNTVVGHSALSYLTTGDQNTAVGRGSLNSVTTGSYNSAFGFGALNQTTGQYNTAVGVGSLQLNTTASNNTAVGYQAAYSNTTGNHNAAFGRMALTNNTTGVDSTALGNAALISNTTGNYNVAVGSQALVSNTTASNNTVVGYQAGYSQTTADSFGSNTFIGQYAGHSTTGSRNSFLGAGAGNAITSGARNTIIGRYNGNENGLDIRTSSNNIVLSDGDGNPRMRIGPTGASTMGGATYDSTKTLKLQNVDQNNAASYAIYAVGRQTGANGRVQIWDLANTNDGNAYFLYCENSTNNVLNIRGDGDIMNLNNSYGAISDQKLKENIQDASSQWDDVKALRVRKYSYISAGLDAPNQLGVVAQELEASGMSGLIKDSPDVNPHTGEDFGTVTKTVKYSVLYMKAVKALQEAMDRIETLETKVTALEAN